MPTKPYILQMNTLFSTNEAHHTLILRVSFVVSVHNFHNGKCGKRLEKRVNASKINIDYPQICCTTHTDSTHFLMSRRNRRNGRNELRPAMRHDYL